MPVETTAAPTAVPKPPTTAVPKPPTTAVPKPPMLPCDLEETVPEATECHGWTCDIETQRCAAGTPGATVDGNRCCFGMWLRGEGERTLIVSPPSDHASMLARHVQGYRLV